MKNIIFACIEKNIGDDLFIYAICKRYQNQKFYIDYSAKYGDLKKIKNLRFSRLLQIWNRLSNIDKSSKSKCLIANIVKKIIYIIIGRHNTGIYIVGNAFKNMDYTGKVDSDWIRDRLQITEKFFLLSTNFGPFNDKKWVDDCDELFKQMTDVCFRDVYSYNLFKNNSNVRFAPDTILTLEPEFGKDTEDIIIISMIDCAMPTRGERLNKASKVYEENLINAANYYIDKGFKIVLLTSNYEQDYPSAKRIYSKIKDKNMCSIFKYTGNFKDVFYIYSKAKYVISTRLHTLVLSWIYDTPVLPIVYDIKIKNLLDSYGFNNDYYDIDSPIRVSDLDLFFNSYINEFNDTIKEQANKQFLILDNHLIGDSSK